MSLIQGNKTPRIFPSITHVTEGFSFCNTCNGRDTESNLHNSSFSVRIQSTVGQQKEFDELMLF